LGFAPFSTKSCTKKMVFKLMVNARVLPESGGMAFPSWSTSSQLKIFVGTRGALVVDAYYSVWSVWLWFLAHCRTPISERRT